MTVSGPLRAALLAGVLASCAPAGPRAIAYGRESCAYCRMTVSDPRFAAELVTVKGRIYTFDSIECLASYYLANQSTARSLWVTDATTPGILIPAESARYARGGAEAPAGAMGLALRATADGSLSWSDVLALAEHDRLGTSGSKPGPQ